MKYLKLFEMKSEEDEAAKKQEQDDLFDVLFAENPLSKDHDFYMFVGSPKFVKNEDGSYRKTLDIENMVKMTRDSYRVSGMLSMRARFQGQGCEVYHIWLPNELEDEVAGKGSNSMEPWLVELIDKYKMKGATKEGIDIYKDVIKRQKRVSDIGLW